MLLWLLWLLCFVVSVVDVKNSDLSHGLNEWVEIINGRHLDDVITSTDEHVIRTSTLLVLYNKNCQDEFNDIKRTLTSLPSASHVLLAQHDDAYRDMNCWYATLPHASLRSRYGVTHTCLEVVFLPATGSLRFAVPWFANLDPDLEKWVWARFKVSVVVTNQLHTPVRVSIEGTPFANEDVVIGGSASKTIAAFLSSTIVSTDDKTGNVLLRRTIMQTSAEKMTLEIGKEAEVDDNVHVAMQLEAIETTLWRRSVSRMHATSFKQPPLLPSLTASKTGVQLVPLHASAQITLNHLDPINTPDLEPVVNSRNCDVTSFQLREDAKQDLLGIVKAEVNKWSRVKVEVSDVRVLQLGVGCRMRHHVGEVATQVLAMVFPVLRGDGNETNDVISVQATGFDGRMRNVTIDSKHMLLYESAKVMMSTSARRDVIILCQVFFKPLANWRWSQHDDVISDGSVSMSVFSKESVIPRHTSIESLKDQHEHDEL